MTKKRGPDSVLWKLQFYTGCRPRMGYWMDCSAEKYGKWKSWEVACNEAVWMVEHAMKSSLSYYRLVSKDGIRFPFVRPPYA